jgi:hypothetical protein
LVLVELAWGVRVPQNSPTHTRKKKMSNGNFDDYYKQLEGFKIHKFLGMADNDTGGDGFAQFHLKKPNYKDIMIEVSRDPEGNGGGFLFISDVK